VAALYHGVEHREMALADRIELRDRSAILLQRLGEPVAALAAAAAEPQRVVEARATTSCSTLACWRTSSVAR